ncbi:beta-propeller fold lactonase family protein [Methanosarcina sp.]|uniref:YVTN family beta-propeller repeat protein n=1 Tax=Methanosarcina sp. TaxID=2213 RepID=UPI003C756E68
MRKKEKSNPRILASTALLLFLTVFSFTISVAAAQSTSPDTIYAYITNGGSDTVSVIDTATKTVIATVNVESRPEGVSVTPDGTGVYVANLGSNTVSVIDTATNTVTATVGVGTNPHGVAVTPDGEKVYVTNYGGNTVSVIDTATNRVTATVNAGVHPFGVAVEGTKAYVTNDVDRTVSVIDTATDTVTATVNVENQYPGGVAVAGTKVYVMSGSTSNVSIIDTATSTVTATVNVGTRPTGAAVSPDGRKVYVANMDSNTISVIDTATDTVTNTVSVGKSPYGVAVNPDGTEVYVANDHENTVSVIDTATNTVTATVKVGNFPKAFGQFTGSIPVPEVETDSTEELEKTPADSQESAAAGQNGDTQTSTVNNYYDTTQTNTQTNTQTTTVNNYYSSEPAERPESIEAEQPEDAPEEKPDVSSASVNLHGEKTEVLQGEDILLKLSAVNLITKPTMHVQAIIIPPSGMSVSSTEFVQSGAGQYTTTYEIEPGKGRDIEVRIAANQVGDFNVTGRIVYYFGDDKEAAEDHALDLPIHIKDPAPQPTPEPASEILQGIPGFGAISLLMVLMLVYALRRK